MRLRPGLVLAGIVAVVVLCLVVLVRAGCRKDEGPVITGTDTLPDSTLVKERPKPPATFGQKIVRHRVPSRITVSRGTPDTVRAMLWADAAHEADSLRRLVDSLRRGDSTDQARASRVPPPKKLLPPVAGRYQGNKLTLWLTRSDGSLLRATAKLRPNFEFYSGQSRETDTFPDFSEDRFWVRALRETAGCLPRAGLVGGAGALVSGEEWKRNGLIAAGAALVGCLAD